MNRASENIVLVGYALALDPFFRDIIILYLNKDTLRLEEGSVNNHVIKCSFFTGVGDEARDTYKYIFWSPASLGKGILGICIFKC